VTPDRTAVVLPGGMFGPHAPLLMYTADAAERRGARVWPILWSRPDELPTLDPASRGSWVRNDAEPALKAAGEGALVIAKSLGTYAAPLAADRRLPAIWLTPVLTDSWVVDGLRRATAPLLIVGGTADPLWHGDVARELTPYVLEVPGADHGMYVEGPLARSAEVLGQVATAAERFLDDVVWP
jgi:alpha-beta hydrolase superfamily lysophospholipase